MKLLTILSVSLCLLLTPFVYGQNGIAPQSNNSSPASNSIQFTPGDLQWGIKLGFNTTSSSVIGLRTFFPEPEFGPVCGGTLALPFGDYLGVQTALLYTENVFADEITVIDPYSYLDRASYLNVPLLVQIKPWENFSLLVGGNYSLLIANTYSYGGAPPIVETVNEQIEGNNQRRNVFGAEFGIDFSIGDLVLGGRITLGMPNNNNANPQNIVAGQLTFGYIFGQDDDE